MKRVLIFLGFILLLIFANLSVINSVKLDSNVKVDNAVYETLGQEGRVKVFISLKEQPSLGIKAFGKNEIKSLQENIISELSALPENEFKLRHEFDTSFSAEISREALEMLKQDSRVASIEEVGIVHAFLSESVPMINATLVWPIKVNGVNLTGDSQTICIIDTGVNYSHPDLGGCFGNNTNFSCKVIAGYDYVNNDTNPMDDHFHGTYVSGIVAGNGSIIGVAPGAKIVAIKVLNSAGSGATDNVKAGIDWCVNNASIFNISVISMSLGCGTFSSYCDDDTTCNSDQIASSINNAIAKNITVVVATGNAALTTKIASPACIRNVTSVGDVYDANVGGITWVGTCTDSTTFADKIVCHCNRNSITTLLAPGALINSSSLVGYVNAGGTSAAAPHVSGAIALLKQYKKLEKNENLTTNQIKDVLNRTGKNIADSASGLNLSRINVWAALVSIDETAPTLTLSNPENITYTTNISLPINFTVSDNLNLSNCWYSLDSAVNVSLQNCANITFNTTFGSHTFTLYANDSAGNMNVTNVTFNVNPVVNLLLPMNSTLSSTNDMQTFSCNASDSSGLQNITLYVWNSTALVHTNTSNKTGETYNQTNFSYALPYEGVFKWNCKASDNASNFAFAGNYTYTISTDYNISGCRNISFAGTYRFNTSITNSNSTVCIGILSSDVVLDCQDYKIDGSPGLGYPYSYYGIQINNTLSKFDNITVRNCILSDWDAAAIQLMRVENSTIVNNTIYSNQNGIEIIYSNYNTIINNNITSSYYSSITLSGSYDNRITNNNLSFNNSININQYSNSQNNSLINSSFTGGNNYDINISDGSGILKNIIAIKYTFSNVSLEIENSSYAKVDFPNITQNGTNFSADVVLRHNYTFINSTNAAGLNRSANLTFLNLQLNNPRILRDGSACPASICSIIAWNSSNGTLIFNVTSFSAYSAEDYCGNGNCDSDESCNSCSTDCGACSAPPISGGGGGGGGVSYSTYSVGAIDNKAEGVTRELGKSDRIKFNVSQSSHILLGKSVAKDNATFELNSSSKIFTLTINETRKFNFSNYLAYDLSVSLNKIVNNKADITVKAISELIPQPKVEIANVTNITEEKPAENITKPSDKTRINETKKPIKGYLYAVTLIFLLILVIYYTYKILKRRKAIKKAVKEIKKRKW